MSLQDKVPVEPIEPDRLERLERRIVLAAGPVLARPRRPSFWPVGLALAGAAAGAIAMYALRPAPPVPTTPPLAVTTDERGATLSLGEASIAAGPETKYDVVRAGGGIDVRLDRGTVRLDVAPRANRPPLWVHAGDVGVRVVGTAFTVTRAPGDGEVSVEVEHGTVEVHQAGAVAPVTRGQRWSSRDGTVIAMAPSPDAPTPGTGSASGASSGSSVTGDGRIGAGGTHTADLATGRAIDVAVLADRDRPTVAPGSGSGSSRVTPRAGSKPGHGSAAGSSATDVPPDDLTDVRSEIRRQPVAAGMAVSGATADERIAELRRLASWSRGAEAATALYSLARVQHVEKGKHSDALKTLDAYRTRFPKGAELEAVLWLRLKILCAGTFGDQCRAAAYSYVQTYSGDDDAKIRSRVAIAARVPLQP